MALSEKKVSCLEAIPLAKGGEEQKILYKKPAGRTINGFLVIAWMLPRRMLGTTDRA
jgi:hypothetical protein